LFGRGRSLGNVGEDVEKADKYEHGLPTPSTLLRSLRSVAGREFIPRALFDH
jgi:hypothetical protein